MKTSIQDSFAKDVSHKLSPLPICALTSFAQQHHTPFRSHFTVIDSRKVYKLDNMTLVLEMSQVTEMSKSLDCSLNNRSRTEVQCLTTVPTAKARTVIPRAAQNGLPPK